MNYNQFHIGQRMIGGNSPTYFIADIAANHNGDLGKAKELIYLAKEAGADAAKFQHFKAKTIVSDRGFKSLGSQLSHQKNWKKSVVEVYQDAEVPLSWTEALSKTCQAAGIDFFTSPYDMDDIDFIDLFVPAYKVGSGDITFHSIIMKMAKKGKPMLMATGASTLVEVEAAVARISSVNPSIAVMQCNTNYTAEFENFKHINLNVLKTYAQVFPNVVLGLSDHTFGHATVLGAIALGAKVIEKHFTDNNAQEGPDHKFSMNPVTWRDMMDRARELELAMGDGIKRIEANEKESSIVQRRCLRVNKSLNKGDILSAEYLEALRPAPQGAILPYQLDNIIGKKLTKDLEMGEELTWEDLVDA